MRALLFLFLFLAFACESAVAFSTVILDAGHGGHDRGGIPGQRLSEKALALDVTLRVNAILKAHGVKTVLTRRRDVFVSLPDRVAIGNRHRNALFVSIHYNSARREGACGFETFYYSPRSARVAYRIQSELLKTCRTENRGVKRRGFYVIRHSRNPAVLVECGFLTNRREAALNSQPAHRQRIAAAIARGILRSR